MECTEEVGLSEHFLLLSLIVVRYFVNLAQDKVGLTDYAVRTAPSHIQGVIDTL